MIQLLTGGPRPSKRASGRVLQLRVTLLGTQPPVWRQVQVRESMWLSGLHDAIQVCFDWFDYQTHQFALGDARYGNPRQEKEFSVEDDRDISLAELSLPDHSPFLYVYEFGEGWRVEIKFETSVASEKGVRYPVCTGGERAGPPEDCGSLEAFHDMLACLQEPGTEIGDEWRAWVGPDYEPGRCDLAVINQSLRKLRR